MTLEFHLTCDRLSAQPSLPSVPGLVGAGEFGRRKREAAQREHVDDRVLTGQFQAFHCPLACLPLQDPKGLLPITSSQGTNDSPSCSGGTLGASHFLLPLEDNCRVMCGSRQGDC